MVSVIPTPKDCQKAYSLKGAGYIAELRILMNACRWNLYALETLSGAYHDSIFTRARHELRPRSTSEENLFCK